MVGYNSHDNPNDAKHWLAQFGNPYPALIVADVDGRIAIDWGIYGAPETFLVDANGNRPLEVRRALTEEVVGDQLLLVLHAEAGDTMKRCVLALMPLGLWSFALAAAPNVYRNAAEEARFDVLASSLRCVMCQNESLADSQAPIAHDLRREILELMRQGRSDAQIRDFLVARYGEFVLYQPRVEPATWLLWFGPLLLLAGGGATVAWVVRRRAIRARSAAGGESAPRAASGSASGEIESSEDW